MTLVIQRSMRGKKYLAFHTGRPRLLLTGFCWSLPAFILLGTVWLVSVALPCITFLTAIPGMDIFWNTIVGSFDELLYSTLLSLLCAAAALAFAFPYAYLLARRHPFQSLIDFLALLPLAVPAALYSLGLIKAADFSGLHALSPTSLFCLAALTAHFLFPGVKILQAGIEQIDFRGEEAAFLTEPSAIKTVFNIILPRLKPGAAVLFFLVFICCFSELSASILLVPPGRETIAVKIYNLMHYGADDMLASLCLFIIMIMLLTGFLFTTCYSWIQNEHRS